MRFHFTYVYKVSTLYTYICLRLYTFLPFLSAFFVFLRNDVVLMNLISSNITPTN